MPFMIRIFATHARVIISNYLATQPHPLIVRYNDSVDTNWGDIEIKM